MRVHVSDPSYVPELVDDLLEGGCVPAALDRTTVEVTHPEAGDAKEARTELTFFLRAWQFAHPGVQLTLSVV